VTVRNLANRVIRRSPPGEHRLNGLAMQAFVVRLPSGQRYWRYWTVLGEDLRVQGAADAFLQQMRFGRGCAESTTRAYATSTALYLLWCRQVHVTGAMRSTDWARSRVDTDEAEAIELRQRVAGRTREVISRPVFM
jgi:hypothetical protein